MEDRPLDLTHERIRLSGLCIDLIGIKVIVYCIYIVASLALDYSSLSCSVD